MNAAPLEVVTEDADALTLLERERRETKRLRAVLEAVVQDARDLAARLPSCGRVSRDTAAGGLLLLAGAAMEALETAGN